MKFDVKSVILGLVAGLCIMLTFGYSESDNNERYQCSADGGYVYVIDTQTGHVWKISNSSTVDFGTPQERKSQESYITPKG